MLMRSKNVQVKSYTPRVPKVARERNRPQGGVEVCVRAGMLDLMAHSHDRPTWVDVLCDNFNNTTEDNTMMTNATTIAAAPFFNTYTGLSGFYNNPEAFVERVLSAPDLPATLVVGSPDLPCEFEMPLHELAATFADFRLPRCRFVKTTGGVWFLVFDPHARADLPVRTEDGSLAEPVTAFTITYAPNADYKSAVYQRHIRERNAAAPTAPCDEHHCVVVSIVRTVDDAGVENVRLDW